MRTDVKLGLVASLVVIAAAGWYFVGGQSSEADIPLIDDSGQLQLAQNEAAKPESTAKTPVAKDAQRSRPRSSSPMRNRSAKRSADASEPRTRPQTAQSDKNIRGRSGSNTPASRQAAASRRRAGTQADPAQSFAPKPKPSNQPSVKTGTKQENMSGLFAVDGKPKPAADSGSAARTSQPTGVQARTASGRDAQTGASGRTAGANRPKSTPAAAMETHTVQPGDSIIDLARRYYGDARYVKPIVDANPQLGSMTTLAVGTIVNLPDVQLPPVAKPASKPVPTRRPAANKVATSRTHTVAEGETLYQMAVRYYGEGSRWRDLYEANKAAIGDDPAALKIGMVLKVPAK